jgi:hypothetical protein
MRKLRMGMVGGVLGAADYTKLKFFNDICQADAKISLTHEQMHTIFQAIKQAIGSLILDDTAHLPGAPKPEDIVDIAAQNAGHS